MVDRIVLGSYPTPVEAAPRLARALGLDEEDLLVKRDDLLGLGGGGNKVRKLERTTAEAVRRGATTLVTTGAAQSNHARLTAAAGARLGLAVELVLVGDAPDPADPVRGNLLLDHLLGAALHWAGDVDAPGLERRAAERVAELGDAAYLVPYGGSNAAGAAAYADAGHELLEQVPDLAHVVVAVGSGGTMAGLLAALGPDRVLGVDTGATTDPEARVRRLAAELDADPAGPLRLRLDQVGDGYSTLPGPVQDALVMAARTEGIVLDPVYTGRALAGLAAAAAEGDVRRGERTVLLHTGGLPGLFGSAAAPAFAAGLQPGHA